MVSEMCIEDIEQMKAEGLEPTPQDIIRLNELALAFERKKSRLAFTSTYMLPRTAHIGESTWFRQPTLGHEIWLHKVASYINMDSVDSALAIYAFAFSRDYKDLPEPYDQKLVKEEVGKWIETMKDFNREQILAAVEYVQTGIESSVGEYPEVASSDEETDDWNTCVAVGVLNEGAAVLTGVTRSELMGMTRREAEGILSKAYLLMTPPIGLDANAELADYNRTHDKIRERLLKEKEAKNNG